MAITVKVAGVDRTSAVLTGSLRVTSKGYAGAGTASVQLLAPAADPNPEDAFEVLDGATTIFKGKVRNRRRQLSRKRPTPQKLFTLDAQDQTSLLTDDVCDTGALRSTSETDKARVEWILTTFGTKGVVGGSTVQQVLSGNMPEAQDFTGMNVYEAIEEVAKVSGARFYVDYATTPALHYFATETAAAPFNLSDSPNGVTTFGYEQFELPDDTIELVNAVYVIGAEGTTPVWRPDPVSWPTASHTTYGRREGSLRDGSLTTQAALEAAGDALIAVQGEPRGPITLVCFKAGLRAGMTIDLTNATYGLSAVNYPITQVEFSLLPGTATFGYRVTLADAPTDLIGYMADVNRRVSSAVGAGEEAVGAGEDTTAPAAPTGLVLTPATKQAPDGTLYPVIDADWNSNSEPDLDAYEIQLERALEGEVAFTVSASGSGGSLPAGDYAVVVTGVGLVQGETIRSAVQVQVVTSGQRLFVNITAKSGVASYRIHASRDTDPKFAQTTSTTGSNVEVTAEGTGAVAPSSSTALAFLTPAVVRTALSVTQFEAVQGGVYYGARVRAIDKSGNYSGYSSVAVTTATADTSAPAIPTGLSIIAGFRRLGLIWLRNLEPDLDHYELRYAAETTPGSALPDTVNWVKREARSTIQAIDGLEPGTLYFVQLRAVDRSGNVRTSVETATAVNAEANPEAGWSNTATAKTGGGNTTLAANADIGATNIKVASVANLAAGDILKVGTAPEFRIAVTVGTAGAGGTGIDLSSPLAVAHASGQAVVEVVDAYVALAPLSIGTEDIAAGAITAELVAASGIEADKITSGTLRLGGIPGVTDLLIVYNAAGDELARIDENGAIFYDAANPDRRMRWLNGTLEFSDDGGVTWATGIGPEGVNASAITFGSGPGGSNVVPNSGFELTAFSTLLQKIWDVTTDWDDATSQVNLSVGGASLNMTDVTY